MIGTKPQRLRLHVLVTVSYTTLQARQQWHWGKQATINTGKQQIIMIMHDYALVSSIFFQEELNLCVKRLSSHTFATGGLYEFR